MYFEERLGRTFTRANNVRPMDRSLRRYWSFSAVFEFSFGLIVYLGAWDTFDSSDPLALYGAAGLGAVFIMFAFGSTVMLLLDEWRRRQLRRMSRSQIRARLQRELKSHRV
jgi:hypothetical protein